MEPKTKTTFQKILNIIMWVFLSFSLLSTVFAFIANLGDNDYPLIGKTGFLCVQTDSMDSDDGFAKGDLIVSTYVENGKAIYDLKVGQVVSFKISDINDDGKEDLNSHRIVDIQGEGVNMKYITQGDNQPDPDNPVKEEVKPEDIIFVWKEKGIRKIKGLGEVISFFQSKYGFLFCIVVPLGGLFIYELIKLVMVVAKYKYEKTGDNSFSKEEEELIKKKAIEEYLAKQKAKEN